MNKALEVDPTHAVTHEFLGWTYEAMGKYEDAVKCYLRAVELSGRFKDAEADLASCYALMGKRDEARKILENMLEYSKGNFVSPVDIALIFAGLGEKDQVFAWLEKAFRERDVVLLENLKPDHRFDPVRSDSRYAELLRKIGLEK